MTFYFIKNESNNICGYTETKLVDEKGKLLPGYIELIDPTEDFLNDFIKYKVQNGEIVKMSNDEFKKLYPNYGVIPKPIEEQQDEMLVQLAYELSMMDLGGGENA